MSKGYDNFDSKLGLEISFKQGAVEFALPGRTDNATIGAPPYDFEYQRLPILTTYTFLRSDASTISPGIGSGILVKPDNGQRSVS